MSCTYAPFLKTAYLDSTRSRRDFGVDIIEPDDSEMGKKFAVEKDTFVGSAKGDVTWEEADARARLLASYMDAELGKNTSSTWVKQLKGFRCITCKHENSSKLFQPCKRREDCSGVPGMPGFRPSSFPLDMKAKLRPMALFGLLALGIGFGARETVGV